IADVVLKELALRIKDCTRKSDTAARLGGDEFGVILEGLSDKEGAEIAVRRFQKAMGQGLEIEEREIAITATIGVAFYPSDGEDVDVLLHRADLALSHAKERKGGMWEFYRAELSQQSHRDESQRALIKQKLASLTPREREVLDILVAGNAN